MKWNYIMDCQPKHGDLIIQVDRPYYGHCTIGMRGYCQNCSFEEVLKFAQDNGLIHPDFWWVYAKDFDWPEEIKHEMINEVPSMPSQN